MPTAGTFFKPPTRRCGGHAEVDLLRVCCAGKRTGTVELRGDSANPPTRMSGRRRDVVPPSRDVWPVASVYQESTANWRHVGVLQPSGRRHSRGRTGHPMTGGNFDSQCRRVGGQFDQGSTSVTFINNGSTLSLRMRLNHVRRAFRWLTMVSAPGSRDARHHPRIFQRDFHRSENLGSRLGCSISRLPSTSRRRVYYGVLTGGSFTPDATHTNGCQLSCPPGGLEVRGHPASDHGRSGAWLPAGMAVLSPRIPPHSFRQRPADLSGSPISARQHPAVVRGLCQSKPGRNHHHPVGSTRKGRARSSPTNPDNDALP